MKKPNLALRLMASAMSAKRKALAAKTERVAQIYFVRENLSTLYLNPIDKDAQ